MEFGTGGKVDVPEEWHDLAMSFKGKSTGSYEDGLRHIREWLKKQGGDPEDAEWVFYLILKNGLEPRPFMYPAFLWGKKVYKKDMEFAWKQLIKKFNNG
jgi:putative transposon-encoded protein